MSDLPILYSFRRCPYAMRARMAIAAAGLTCKLREVVLRDKPAEMLEVSPKGTVPVIVDIDGRIIEESLDVMVWALNQNDPEDWLHAEIGTHQDMLDLIAACDGPFKQALDHYKYPDRYEGIDRKAERALGLNFLEELNLKLTRTDYVLGNRACLADIAIFPFIRQFANTDRAWFDGLALPSLRLWLTKFLESKHFQAIMKKYPQWKPGDIEPHFPETN